jgi:NAD(P)-dependent dehydrogenase (short-subunit alcohol dehydrogenase family)
MQLTDQVAIITGSARGIGSAIALCLAREGARTIVADINAAGAWEAAAEIEALGRRAIAVETDVAGQDQVQAMVERAIEFGRVDILVNNAGNAVLTPLLETAAAAWDCTLKPHTVWHLLHRRFLDISFIIPLWWLLPDVWRSPSGNEKRLTTRARPPRLPPVRCLVRVTLPAWPPPPRGQ